MLNSQKTKLMDNLILKNKKILIIAAHPDDEVLGCGGTILKLKKNKEFKILFLTNGVSPRIKSNKNIKTRRNECLNLFSYLKISKPTFFDFPDNQLDKVPLLKIVKKIEEQIKLFKPNIVLTHSINCLNVDHQIAYNATITACRPINNSLINTILSFEVASSTEWKMSKKNFFFPNLFIDITDETEYKIKCLKFYKSELRKFPHSRSIEGIKTIAKYRGISSGIKYAEAFEIVRQLYR